MRYGVCDLTVIPLRARPNHESEMVSQILFAETFKILDQTDNWLHIKCSADNYTGWVDEKQIIELELETFDAIRSASSVFAKDIVHTAKSIYKELPVLMGSPLPFYRNHQFSLFENKFKYDGTVVDLRTESTSREQLKTNALKFINAPYLWGGRSPLGIDCSGFVQTVYRFANIQLNRDAADQAEQGRLINQIEDSETGDLAFFANERGKITHVGIMLNNNQIIHAHGRVRIDSVDPSGIFNVDTGKYSHKYHSTKRFIEEESD
ncbi:C40 family peptidase [Chitinophagales bacterium]|nr:C40 family peptidase [Chitinophagales bacterium]